MKNDDNKNMIYFLMASMVMLFAYQFLVVDKQTAARQAQKAAAAAAASSAAAAGLTVGPSNLTRDQALALSPRVKIDTPSLKGSISLKGALIDDLYLAKYHTAVDAASPLVELLRPANADHGYYVDAGFNTENIPNAPGVNSLWSLVSGDTLSVGKPVVLGYDNGAGLKFTRTLSIDDNYMITQVDQVANSGATPVTLAPFSMVVRDGIPTSTARGNYVHEGSMVTFSNASKTIFGDAYQTQSTKYKGLTDDAKKNKVSQQGTSVGGWYAITDKYWMAAVIPDQHQPVKYTARADILGETPIYRSGYVADAITIAPGQAHTVSSHIFAGAKLDTLLQAYQKSLSIPRFFYAIDWGSLSFITYPFYWVLIWLNHALGGVAKVVHIGSFGLAILALTVLVKICFYPLAHRSQVSMVKMKHVQQRLQPKLDAIKKRFENDPQKQQEATMALYQEEKVNPMASLGGCLPMLLQIPVFISLYKVLQLAIEMRHAPFFGWINDLSAPDPKTIVNLFGLLPFNPATVPLIGGFLDTTLHIGIVSILYGASMWLSQQMTPTTGIDPTQKKMMALMPLLMVFFFSQLAVGLMIYYFWNSILTILQQYTIMRRLKVENPIDDFIAKISNKSEKKTAA